MSVLVPDPSPRVVGRPPVCVTGCGVLDSRAVSRHLATFAILLGLLAAIVALTPYHRALERQDASGATVTTSLSCDAPLTQSLGSSSEATEVGCGSTADRRAIVAAILLISSMGLGVLAYRRQGPLADLVAP